VRLTRPQFSRPRPAAPPMREDTKRLALSAKGFLSEVDGLRLYELAWSASVAGPCLEVGSYCGKSALFLAEGCRARGRHGVFSVDHHRGSEEQQPGQEYFDRREGTRRHPSPPPRQRPGGGARRLGLSRRGRIGVGGGELAC